MNGEDDLVMCLSNFSGHLGRHINWSDGVSFGVV